MAGGRWIRRERRATTGKVAAKELLAQMIKREAMRRPLNAVSPPPEPQFVGEDSEDILGRQREEGGLSHWHTVVIDPAKWSVSRHRGGPHGGPGHRREARPSVTSTLAVLSIFLISGTEN